VEMPSRLQAESKTVKFSIEVHYHASKV